MDLQFGQGLDGTAPLCSMWCPLGLLAGELSSWGSSCISIFMWSLHMISQAWQLQVEEL